MAYPTLEKLYCGTNPNTENIQLTSEYLKARSEYAKIYEEFEKGLNEGQKKTFDDIFNAVIYAESLISEQNFEEGFKFGLRVGAEVFKD